MTQSKTLIIVLVIGFGAGFVLRPVIVRDSAVAESLTHEGTARGDECANAEQAVIEAEGRERFKKFMGN